MIHQPLLLHPFTNTAADHYHCHHLSLPPQVVKHHMQILECWLPHIVTVLTITLYVIFISAPLHIFLTNLISPWLACPPSWAIMLPKLRSTFVTIVSGVTRWSKPLFFPYCFPPGRWIEPLHLFWPPFSWVVRLWKAHSSFQTTLPLSSSSRTQLVPNIDQLMPTQGFCKLFFE